MGKYVHKKHGIVIGAEPNGFFIRRIGADGHQVSIETYSATVDVYGLRFTQANTVNVAIRTPMEQMIWVRRPSTPKERENPACHSVVMSVSDFARRWLDANAPGWGTHELPNSCDATIFFKHRSHAVAFYKKMADMLDGMCFANTTGKSQPDEDDDEDGEDGED